MVNIIGTKILMTRGDTLIVEIGMSKDGQAYTPEEGDVVRFALKQTHQDVEPLILKVIPNDTCILRLNPEDTKPLAFGSYVYDMEITMADGSVDTFINNAVLQIVPEVY